MTYVRRTPYSDRHVAKMPCARCGKPSLHQWQICADDNRFRGICEACDILLNDLVLRFVRDGERVAKMKAYRERCARDRAAREREHEAEELARMYRLAGMYQPKAPARKKRKR